MIERKENVAILRRGSGWVLLQNPTHVLCAETAGDVPCVLADAEKWADRGGTSAGFVGYEAAPVFDPALVTHPPGETPLAWFGLYTGETPISLPVVNDMRPPRWERPMSLKSYRERFRAIQSLLRSGDTYQANLTFRLHGVSDGDDLGLFVSLLGTQNSPNAAFFRLPRFSVCSLSPELFFRLEGTTIESRPMKGTRTRGRTTAEDDRLARELQDSEKEKAENIMIVDMIRNDLGRIARPGSVKVPYRFRVERYPTVLQMVSRVVAQTDSSIGEIFSAIFPCASVTGAPKARTMAILSELEADPRGIYCGAVGSIGPGRRARFNVAIRTLVLDRAAGTATYGVGGGITTGSVCRAEYAECLAKAAILTDQPPTFQLLETLRWSGEEGYFLLDEHLARLRDSAAYFAFCYPAARLLRSLESTAADFDSARDYRVRVLISKRGGIRIQHSPLPPHRDCAWRVRIADEPVDEKDRFLYHKTTRRCVYEAARAGHPDVDDVLLFNREGEMTESTLGNLVVDLGAGPVTPPVSCGLLAGTFRRWLLEKGEVREEVVLLADLPRARNLWVVNSVRGRVPVELLPTRPPSHGRGCAGGKRRVDKDRRRPENPQP